MGLRGVNSDPHNWQFSTRLNKIALVSSLVANPKPQYVYWKKMAQLRGLGRHCSESLFIICIWWTPASLLILAVSMLPVLGLTRLVA